VFHCPTRLLPTPEVPDERPSRRLPPALLPLLGDRPAPELVTRLGQPRTSSRPARRSPRPTARARPADLHNLGQQVAPSPAPLDRPRARPARRRLLPLPPAWQPAVCGVELAEGHRGPGRGLRGACRGCDGGSWGMADRSADERARVEDAAGTAPARDCVCGRRAVTRGLCRRCYGRALRGLPPVDEASISAFGQPDGYGGYGYLDVDVDGKRVLCHECGEWFASLGRHLSVTHGISSGEYRAAHGLARGQGLLAPELATRRADVARARIGSASWRRMQAAAASPAVRAARIAAFKEAVAGKPQQGIADRLVRLEHARRLARGQRVWPVLTCSVCGALWCPIVARVRSRQTCGSRECVRTLIARRARLRTRSQRAK